jgi:hypothetical protein
VKLEPGDKIRIKDASKFLKDFQWLEGETVEVIKVRTCGGLYPILARHINDPRNLHLAYDDVEEIDNEDT